jgi:hypothetical protein
MCCIIRTSDSYRVPCSNRRIDDQWGCSFPSQRPKRVDTIDSRNETVYRRHTVFLIFGGSVWSDLHERFLGRCTSCSFCLMYSLNPLSPGRYRLDFSGCEITQSDVCPILQFDDESKCLVVDPGFHMLLVRPDGYKYRRSQKKRRCMVAFD